MRSSCSVSRHGPDRSFVPRAWVTIGLAFLTASAMLCADANAGTRPFSDWLDNQGKFCPDPPIFGCVATSGSWLPISPCCLFVPPVANFFGWTNNAVGQGQITPTRLASVDYAGLAESYVRAASGGTRSLGTQVSGTVSEQPQADGTALVTVTVHTRNALCWVVDNTANTEGFRGPLLFGFRAPEVLAGAQPALGTSNMKVVFTNSAPGAPLPDLAFVSFKSLSLWASASGPLRSLFGVPEGTQGQMIVIQQGYFATSFQGAMVDGFPAEQINLIVK